MLIRWYYVGICPQEPGKLRGGIEMFTFDNTEGFTEDELNEMNADLNNRIASGELEGLEYSERVKIIEERILQGF